MDEYEKLEGELADEYNIYLEKFRNLDYLEHELDMHSKVCVCVLPVFPVCVCASVCFRAASVWIVSVPLSVDAIPLCVCMYVCCAHVVMFDLCPCVCLCVPSARRRSWRRLTAR